MSQATLDRNQLHSRLRLFFERHRDEYGLQTLGYFGSYARGEADESSDIDIVFDSDRPNLFRTAMLKQDLEEWLGHPVDVLQLRGMVNERLRDRIRAEAIYVI